MFRMLQAEWMKIRRDKAYIWTIVGFLGAPLMVTMMFLLGRADLIKRGYYTIEFFYMQSVQMQALLLGPIMVAVLATQLMTGEYRYKTLKALLPLPVTLPALFATKVIVALASLIGALYLSNGFTALVAWLMRLPLGANYTYTQLFGSFVRDGARLWVGFSASLVFALLVSLVSKNFVVPLAASAVTIVGGMLALQADKGLYVWTALPLYSMSTMSKDVNTTFIFLSAAVFTITFVLAGMLWARLTTRPE